MTQTQVPFVDLTRQHDALADEIRVALNRVISSSAFIHGHEVSSFEREFAHYCGIDHCVGVSSGTAALSICLQAAGIRPGDEVIVPAHTFAASALAVIHARATPVFCDVDEGSGLIDTDAAAAAVSSRTSAIVPVHLYGQACDMDALQAIAKRHGLFVLEDAAQAHGASYRRQRVGGLGDAAAFSFYPSKNLGALGDAGAICTDDVDISNRARQIRNLGQDRDNRHLEIGYNARLDGLHAAILRTKLPYLDTWNRRRQALAEGYRVRLGPSVKTLVERVSSPCVYHLFPVRLPRREHVRQQLARRGIDTKVHYTPAACDLPALRDQLRLSDGCGSARAWAKEQLSLPMFAELSYDELEAVSRALAESM